MIDRINEDLKKAMKAGEKTRVTTLRVLMSDIQKAAKDKREDLTEQEIIAVISRAVKMRKEAITEFEKGSRDDLVQKETEELTFLEPYLPAQLSEQEIEKAVTDLINELGAAGMKDFGNVMKEMMSRYQGQVDGKIVNGLIKAKLSG